MAIMRKLERDLDVFLAEEFEASSQFADWVLGRSKFLSEKGLVLNVHVSKYGPSGESDLVVTYRLNCGRNIALLIENKIDAGFQPRQAERYRLRADNDVLKGEYSDYDVLLFAPSAYLARARGSGFEHVIAYEELAAVIEGADKGGRGAYRSAFLRNTGIQSIRTWPGAIQDDGTDAFWAAVYRMTSAEFPELEMKPRRVTKGNAWITFRPRDFPTQPKHVYIEVKAPHGRVALTISKTSSEELRRAVSHLLTSEMSVEQLGASAGIVLTAEPYQIEKGLDSELKKVRRCFKCAVELVQFFRANRDAFLPIIRSA